MTLFCSPNKLLQVVLVAVGVVFSFVASAQTYPNRPITLVVPFPPGGIADGTARVVGPALSAALGQPVVIENRGGSGGNLGVAAVARAAPDGYTLLMTPNSPVVQNPFMFKNYPINSERDLAPIAMIGEGYIGLVVQKSSPINSVQDVIAAAKAKPGELTFGNIGVGSSHYFAGALLNKKAGINIIPVPFQGAGPAMQNLLGGHVSMSYGTLSGVLPYVQSGQLKLLAVAESKRVRDLPDVPTIAETVPGVVTSTWEGFFAPAGTPSAIIDRLYEATKKALESPEVQQKLTRIGIVPNLMPPDELKRTVHEDLKFWRQAVETAGLQPQ
jgi:tripartite-type tricarboxylate transporter receptor subunit TctC